MNSNTKNSMRWIGNLLLICKYTAYYMHMRSSSPKTGSEALTENSMFFLS